MSGSGSGSGSSSGSKSICRDCIRCDDKNTITSFPVSLSQTPTQRLYDSVEEPLSINFQWATRSIPPKFTSPESGLIDEGRTSGATNISTFKYRGINYNIQSVQIVKSTHNTWVIPETIQSLNSEDMIITFYTLNTLTKYTYIIIVIPIIRNGSSSTDPSYIKALSLPSATNGSFSLSSCLPQNKNALFAYYSTCLDGYSERKNPENVYTFIAVAGVSVSPELMNLLGKQNIPSANVPFMLRLPTLLTNLSPTDFSRYVLTTRHLLDYSGMNSLFKGGAIDQRTDKTDEYQCVPLDPDTDIVDGQIQIDIENGKLLSKVLEERDAVRAMSAPTTLTREGKNRLETYLGSALGILCAILIFSILLYLIVSYASSKMTPTAAVAAASTAATATTSAVDTWVKQLPLYGIMVIVAGLIGFTVGTTLK